MPLSGQELKLVTALKETQTVLVATMMCAKQVGNNVLHDQAKARYERNDELIREAS